MRQYLNLLHQVRTLGVRKPDRTGTGTLSLFGEQMRFDLSQGFPLVTTKRIHLKSVIHELLWMLSGDTNVGYLRSQGVTIWDEWADCNGNLGPVYGAQWRSWPTMRGPIDQISQLIERLRVDPDSRRHIVTAWNPTELHCMALPPCHAMFQFYSRLLTVEQRLSWLSQRGQEAFTNSEDAAFLHACLDDAGVPRRALDCQLYQRSGDLFLGVPFNIASYALLTLMLAQCVDMAPGDFVHTFGDVHLYLNHLEQADRQLAREPLPLPTMRLNPNARDLLAFHYDDFTLEGYRPYPSIKAPVAV